MGGGGTGSGTIGLGTLGTIGRGGGGGYGYGRLGARASGPAPVVVASSATVSGSLDKEIIRRIIRRHINEVRYCYAKELAAQKSLQGRVVVQFVISAKGMVQSVKLVSSTLNSAAVETCVTRAVQRWLFPVPRGGGVVAVTYPFTFRPAP
jgi:TonB family protein